MTLTVFIYLLSCTFKDAKPPSLKLLLNSKVITDVSAKWYQLGIMLVEEDKEGQLENIKANYHNVTDCCFEMFRYWIQTQPKASWHQLVEALRVPGIEMNDVAESVKKRFIGLLLLKYNYYGVCDTIHCISYTILTLSVM